jgi:hypothetical protein
MGIMPLSPRRKRVNIKVITLRVDGDVDGDVGVTSVSFSVDTRSEPFSSKR